jgi:hypothetical protein
MADQRLGSDTALQGIVDRRSKATIKAAFGYNTDVIGYLIRGTWILPHHDLESYEPHLLKNR